MTWSCPYYQALTVTYAISLCPALYIASWAIGFGYILVHRIGWQSGLPLGCLLGDALKVACARHPVSHTIFTRSPQRWNHRSSDALFILLLILLLLHTYSICLNNQVVISFVGGEGLGVGMHCLNTWCFSFWSQKPFGYQGTLGSFSCNKYLLRSYQILSSGCFENFGNIFAIQIPNTKS